MATVAHNAKLLLPTLRTPRLEALLDTCRNVFGGDVVALQRILADGPAMNSVPGLMPTFYLREGLRLIVGDEPIGFDPNWRTEEVVGLARRIYAGHLFDQGPAVADALEDEGCADPYVLSKLGGPDPCCIGHQVLDAILCLP